MIEIQSRQPFRERHFRRHLNGASGDKCQIVAINIYDAPSRCPQTGIQPNKLHQIPFTAPA
jgi:hypothetical protein